MSGRVLGLPGTVAMPDLIAHFKSRPRLCMLLGIVCLHLYARSWISALRVARAPASTQLGNGPRYAVRKRLACFIITMNASLQAVRLASNVTCKPFLGQRVSAQILSNVDAQVRSNLQRGVWGRGAHYTNNKSVSIAWNHMLVWRKLLQETDGSEDFLILEDDAIITNQTVDVYDQLQKMGLFRHNYIIKLANIYRMKWLCGYELASLDSFSVNNTQYVLKKCVCSTRQNLFNAGAYVLDQDASRALLTEFFPMRFHVDTYLHYTGYKLSNLFVVENDVVEFSGRLSTHSSEEEKVNRMLTEFKEQLLNLRSSDCTFFRPPAHLPGNLQTHKGDTARLQ